MRVNSWAVICELVRAFLHFFYIFPISEKKVFFESYSGKGYMCNPKYISEYLNKKYGDKYSIVWGATRPEDISEQYIAKITKKNSIRYFYERITAKYIVTNVADCVYIPKRQPQILINTWHAGGAYKKVGKSVGNNNKELINWQSEYVRKSTDIFLSSSRKFSETNLHEGYGFDKTILNIGMPRNDLFFDDDSIKSAINKVNKSFHLTNEIVVLYAPTFREKTEIDKTAFPIKQIIKKVENEYKKKCVVLVRSHHFGILNLSNESKRYVIDASNYPDMQELLARADILITDYSSCMWDFSLLKRPCFLYVPDLQSYIDDRGLFTDPDIWPGVVCQDVDQLVNSINHDTIQRAPVVAQKHLDLLGSYEKGNATKTLCEYIWGKNDDKL